jgi:hypothetical protein
LILCGNPEYFQKTIEKEGQFSEEEALLELYRKLRPGEPPRCLAVSSSCILVFLIPSVTTWVG